MRFAGILLVLCASIALCQSVVPAVPAPDVPAAAAPAQPSYVVGMGVEYNHYGDNPGFMPTFQFGWRMTDRFWQVNTLNLGATTATMRAGFGYALVRRDHLLLIALSDAGITTQQNGGGVPLVPSTVTLGNIGSGVLVKYDLGALWKKLEGFGAGGSMRIAAVTSVSVQPAFAFSLGKTF